MNTDDKNKALTSNDAKPMLADVSTMTTDELLVEIVSYDYKSYGFPYVFLDFSQSKNIWEITWRNPADFNNEEIGAETPKKACENAMRFILERPNIFKKRA